MRVRMIGGMVGVAFGLSLVGFTGVAGAQTAGSCVSQFAAQYPPGRTVLVVDKGQTNAGGVVTASGCGSPNGQVRFTLFSHSMDLGSATTDATGAYRASLTIPCDAEQGAHTLRASGAATDSTSLTVSGTTGPCPAIAGTDTARSGSGLPRTGTSSTAPLAAAGIGLLVIGAATAVAARRRRTADV